MITKKAFPHFILLILTFRTIKNGFAKAFDAMTLNNSLATKTELRRIQNVIRGFNYI